MAKVTLELFNATLHHAGNVLHGIPILKASTRELKLLRKIHGEGNIVNLEKVGEAEVDEQLHYFELIRKYGSYQDFAKQEATKALVERTFNIELDGFEGWINDEMQKTESQRAGADAERLAEERLRVATAEAEMRARIEAELRAKIRQEVEDEMTRPVGAVPADVPVAHHPV